MTDRLCIIYPGAFEWQEVRDMFWNEFHREPVQVALPDEPYLWWFVGYLSPQELIRHLKQVGAMDEHSPDLLRELFGEYRTVEE